MMKFQKGVTGLEVLLVLAVLGLAGVGGYELAGDLFTKECVEDVRDAIKVCAKEGEDRIAEELEGIDLPL